MFRLAFIASIIIQTLYYCCACCIWTSLRALYNS